MLKIKDLIIRYYYCYYRDKQDIIDSIIELCFPNNYKKKTEKEIQLSTPFLHLSLQHKTHDNIIFENAVSVFYTPHLIFEWATCDSR